MAQSQLRRRSVSLHRDLYVAASKLALRRDVTLCQLVSDALRAYGVDAPETAHVPREIAERNAEAIRHGIVAREDRQDRRRRAALTAVRLVGSYRTRPGPIRTSLGDAHADACGEPLWKEPVTEVRRRA
jgi:hypothetical protein